MAIKDNQKDKTSEVRKLGVTPPATPRHTIPPLRLLPSGP